MEEDAAIPNAKAKVSVVVASRKENRKAKKVERAKASRKGRMVERKVTTLVKTNVEVALDMVIGVEIVPNVLNKSRTATSTVATTKTDFRDNKCC